MSEKTWELELPKSGKVKLTVKIGNETVSRKLKVKQGDRVVDGTATPIYRTVRDRDGKLLHGYILLPGVRLSLEFSDGTVLEGYSCCKPPDEFSLTKGKTLALRHLLHLDSGIDPSTKRKKIDHAPRLSQEDRQALLDWLLPRKKKKPKEQSEVS